MAKIGRNEPCPCGSGKKYKQCCVNLSAEQFRSLEKLPQEWKPLFRFIEQGYGAVNRNLAKDAIEAWGLAWEELKQLAADRPKMKAFREIDEMLEPDTSLEVFVQDWAELMSALLKAIDAPVGHIRDYATFFLDRMTGSSELMQQNVMRLLAEAHVVSLEYKPALKLYQSIEKQFAAELEEEELQAVRERIEQLKSLSKPAKAASAAKV